jgi:hypothetical protein
VGNANDCGLPASEEWRIIRRECKIMLILGCQRLFYNKKTHKIESGPVGFAIIRNQEELFRVYKALPPADRYLQEMITPTTPHKLCMDIERDMDDVNLSDEELAAELCFMKRGLNEMFIPFLCDFFRVRMQIPITAKDCYVTDSSKAKVKFSVHLVLSTPNVHYFKDRMESWIAMCALVEFMELKTTVNKDFYKWFFHDGVGGRKSTLDFGIYGSGGRNMRMIGACKAAKYKKGTYWKNCRVFLPVESQESDSFDKFIASAYGHAEKTLIVLPDAVRLAVYKYGENKLANCREPCNKWFQNSKNIGTSMKKRDYISPEEITSLNLPVIQKSRISQRGPRTKGIFFCFC